MKLNFKFLLSVLLVMVAIAGYAQKIPAKPNPPRLVNDFAGVLSPGDEQQLEQQLVAADDSTSNQIAVVLVKSLEGYSKEEYANKLFREWGIGNKKTNNGVLILAAIDDRQVWIEVGYGLEGAIPDITAHHIYEDDIVPNFRDGDYYEGLHAAANSLIKAAAGEYNTPRERKVKGGRFPFGAIVFIIIMIIVFASRGGRGGGGGFMSRRGYRGGWLGPFILGSMLGRGSGGGGWGGDSGGGGWSGGGGGFGGFGGGSSGGGGAGGSW
jgi:uncharacterized protein